jgi:glycosyltransferase involved in cell wall biosynthesis
MDLGGLQRIVNILIERLDHEQFDPYLCCLDRGGLFYRTFKKGGAGSYILGRKPGPFDLKMFVKLIQIVKDNRIDIIHSHNGCSLYGAMAGKVCGVKGIVHTDHGRLVPDRQTAIWEDRFASSMMNCFVAVSKELAEYLASVVKVKRKKLITIINGVDADTYIPFSTAEKKLRKHELGLNMDAKLIGTVCRLDPIKNLDMLVDSVPAILQRIPDCQVVIVGDGPEENRLRNRVANLKLSSKIIIFGRDENIQNIMPVFDLFVNTSFSEGTSMTILEAMSCGIPVVASAVGGNEGLVDNFNGALFPSGRADLFQRSVTDLLGNENMLRELGKKSREKVLARFSIDHVLKQYENLYRTLA